MSEGMMAAKDLEPGNLPEVLRRICQLQPSYSAANTPEMQERGRLIRTDLVREIQVRSGILSEALGRFGEDFTVGASDGIGRKTEAPWVRFCSKSMSPSPREGYYAVIHFAADGSAVFFTVGCGSTRWANGMLYHLPKEELAGRTATARKMILSERSTLRPFTDQINLRAKASLPKTFERATVVAKRVDVGELDDFDVDAILSDLGEALRSVYSGQELGQDVTPAEQDENTLEALSKPLKRPSRGAQGYSLTGPERKVVELQAMSLATAWFVKNGYKVEDVSATQSYDLFAHRGGQSWLVEVKGTTSLEPSAVLMTSNEIALHQLEKGKTALVIVSEIRLDRRGAPTAAGGKLEVLLGWDIDLWTQIPTAYRVERSSHPPKSRISDSKGSYTGIVDTANHTSG